MPKPDRPFSTPTGYRVVHDDRRGVQVYLGVVDAGGEFRLVADSRRAAIAMTGFVIVCVGIAGVVSTGFWRSGAPIVAACVAALGAVTFVVGPYVVMKTRQAARDGPFAVIDRGAGLVRLRDASIPISDIHSIELVTVQTDTGGESNTIYQQLVIVKRPSSGSFGHHVLCSATIDAEPAAKSLAAAVGVPLSQPRIDALRFGVPRPEPVDCEHCGYSLVGLLPGRVCPECGAVRPGVWDGKRNRAGRTTA